MPDPISIAIIGGGASATLLLAQLSSLVESKPSKPINIYIIDDSDFFNVGVAYHTKEPTFLLNVAADQMGAYPDKPDDFYQWMINHPECWKKLHTDFHSMTFNKDDFVPRMIYGKYLKWIFDNSVARAATNLHVHRVRARAKHICAIDNSHQVRVVTDSSESVVVDSLVLATGNCPPNHFEPICNHTFSSPYSAEFLAQDWSSTKNVIIVGSGLSMVDAVQYLINQDYRGNFHIFSRNGLIPLPHASHSNALQAPNFSINYLTSARKILHALRTQININSSNDISWQSTINALRKKINTIWLSLPSIERQKLRRYLPWWNIARHRIPETSHNLLTHLQKEGRLTITKSEILKAKGDGDYFLLQGNDRTFLIQSERMVLCSGYKAGYDYITNLCDDLLTPIDELIPIMLRENQISSLAKTHSIYAIGPCLKGLLFETTAIHEIREQCQKLAGVLIK